MSQGGITVSFTDMSQMNFHASARGQMFWSVTSQGGATIGSVRIGSTRLFQPRSQNITSFAIDNVSFAGGTSAPPPLIQLPSLKPKTYTLMLMGLVGVAAAAERKQVSSAPDKACACGRFFSLHPTLGTCNVGVRNAERSKEAKACGLSARIVAGRVRSNVAITSGE